MPAEMSAPRTVVPSVVAIPMRGLDLSVARFPAQPTPLVGREPEIAGIQALLGRDDVRLLTITGPGGGGKTRVAIRAAELAASRFDDAAAFVSLVAVRDPDLVAPAIVQALAGREGGAESPVGRLHQMIGDRKLLLVLDNFEHLVDAAPIVAGLLVACPRLKVLVTSRVALRLAGEHEFRIPPMSLPDPGGTMSQAQAWQADAVRLFVQRAQAARPEFDPAPDALQAVAGICQRLDGLPLAIELAAARITHLSPAALLERLERPASARLPLLTGGARDQPARFQTMRDTIAWSYDLLDGTERSLFQDLSVFPGGFPLAAAEWVAGEGRPERLSPCSPCSLPVFALDVLASLVAKSLIFYEGETGGEPRYGMLETIREFGRERLGESGREADARQRHAEWALALAERAGPMAQGPDAAVWVEALERDHPSLRAALGWFVEQGDQVRLARMAGSLWSFWQEHAHYAEGQRWLEAALELCQDVSPQDRRRLLTGAGAMAWYLADVAHSRQRHEEALGLTRQLGDRAAEAFELSNLAVHAAEAGDHDQAIAMFEASLAAARETGEHHPAVLALSNLAHLNWTRGDGQAARRRLEEALALAREHGIGWLLPTIMIGLGTTTLDLGDHHGAIPYFQESIALAQTRGNLGDVIDGVEGMATVAAATGQAAQAARLFGATEVMRETLAMTFLPTERTQFEPVLNGLRETLGPRAFAVAWSAGRALAREEAIAEALALQAESPAPAATAPTTHGLTDRELEVLRLLAAGHSNREIGNSLYISPATAARHVANISSKLGVDSRAKASAFAHRHGLI